jgi:hypothetical protein
LTSQDTAFFWESADKGVLAVQRCAACGKLRHPPGPSCPACRSLDWDAAPCSGRAELYSYTVVHHPPVPGFAAPFVVGVFELEEGPRIVSNLVGVPLGEVRIGLACEAVLLAQEEGWSVPVFRLRES